MKHGEAREETVCHLREPVLNDRLNEHVNVTLFLFGCFVHYLVPRCRFAVPFSRQCRDSRCREIKKKMTSQALARKNPLNEA